MTRGKKLFYNTVSSLIYQIITIICGFVLPRLILESYGSAVNGLVNSITQFLGVVTFLEMGIGAVIQSSLYQPLAEHDSDQISRIVVSATRFFRRIAVILVGYVCVMLVFYPTISDMQFSWLYIATLIVAMAVSVFMQYYFGAVDQLLLTADQHGYIRYNVQTITVILNTAICCTMIYGGASIQAVKLVTAFVYLLRPIVLRMYLCRHYNIDWHIKYESEPIKQKWNGIAQHVAAVILDGTDTIVLTLFSTLESVSIYSVYYLVVRGVKQLFMAMTNGVQAILGELWAKHEDEALNQTFSWVEWCIHTGTSFVFGCTAVLIVPFVQVYTKGVTDANYTQPLFAAFLVAANAMHCLRLPYNLMVLAAGHYKQTQRNYVEVALINIIVSVLTVKAFGLIGVAIGTVVAMSYQTLWLARYNSKQLINWPFHRVVKQFAVDIAEIVVIALLTNMLAMSTIDYFSWVMLACCTAGIALTVIVLFNLILYKEMSSKLFKTVMTKLKYK